MLNVALPKGRLGNQVYNLLAKIGYECPGMLEDNRKLVFENPERDVRYFLVKPSDVGVYVESGAADVGVVGKDILLENNHSVYELLDLGLGKCRVCVASKNDWVEDTGKALRVATKFVNIAKNYYASINREIEIIKLHGSIEIAPLVDLSDVIVDIVETGSTLRENNMRVFTEIMPISARFIANKTSYRFGHDTITGIVENLREGL